ncbi:hypothetical protein HHI36_022896 [Cryptolaemus montrouzieri]|uniref:Acid phosphatase n=1 Tax=Cryptolaemus montrouzieri TaxID=559131 RepID=A0ABD2PES2_9CUCU
MSKLYEMIYFYFEILLILHWNPVAEVSSSNIKQIHMLFRHGERSPSQLYKNDPHNASLWQDGLGYLTRTGKLQMYNLGQRIRKKYANTIPNFYFPDDVKVLSSYSDRCLMSAQLFTSGLFVPQKEQIWNEELLWQPISMNYMPRSQDNMIASKQECPTYDILYEELFKSHKYKKILQENSELFQYLTEYTGENIDTIRKVEEIYNTLQIEELHNLTLPEWTHEVYPDLLKPLAAYSLASFTETDFMKKIKGGPFVKKVLKNMEDILDNKNSPRFFFYSGHDLTLVNILRTLGFTNEMKPNFAAYLIFELHNTSPATVKIFYSNCGWCEEEELIVQKCMEPCTLDNLKKNLDHLLPLDWSQECNNKIALNSDDLL